MVSPIAGGMPIPWCPLLLSFVVRGMLEHIFWGGLGTSIYLGAGELGTFLPLSRSSKRRAMLMANYVFV